jgi:DNA-binding phage protein
MTLWKNEIDKKERNEIISDIQDLLDDCNQNRKAEEVYIKFNDLETIAKNIRSFKDSLLQIVNEHGGISYLAGLTGIPQPSLSRFFNSNAMPHRSTLLKIAKALELDEIKMDLL